MSIAVLYPRFAHPAIEERYASWQTQMRLRTATGVSRLMFYDHDEKAADVAAEVDEPHVLVVTDPLLLSSPRLAASLRDAVEETGAAAAVPVSNEAAHDAQRVAPPSPYLTLREMEEAADLLASSPRRLESVTWDASDPAVYLCRTEVLDAASAPLAAALQGRDVAIVATEYVHRWSSMRGQTREDLLELISRDARSILEFGCGEAPLGQALKARQRCRVVGIELDPVAASVAERRIDAVYRGDARDIVSILDETFDWIVGGDIVEHLDEPWTFLADLRRITSPGGHLLLSLPNLAHASIVSDLLRGRFDYVYMGLTCVGHLRFFTRASIEEMLTIAGWTVADVRPQELVATPARDALVAALDASGLPYSRADLIATGYYVVARNES